MKRRTLLALLLLGPPALAGWRRENRDECARLDARLKELEAQRRMGYTAKQGRRLEAQREKLAQKRREQCR